MARAVIIGGTGAIGRAAARRLQAAGWSVELTGRDPARMPRDIAAAGGRFIATDTGDAGRLRAPFGGGADLLVDCACFTAEDAAGLLPPVRDTADADLIPGPGDEYFAPLLDYQGEDRWLAAQTAGAG
ncbi:MAG: NAD-dependent epimerase/dehydratase family protein [Gemmatimonadales bacterium]